MHGAKYRLEDISKAMYKKYQRYRAIRFLRDLGPDAEPLREHLEHSLPEDNEYVLRASKLALERLQPNKNFRKVSERILKILAERNPKEDSQTGKR